jgi:hypothetical protein
MFHFSTFRIAILLLYFTFCSACGKTSDKNPKVQTEPQGSTSSASDINYIGGGSKMPEPVVTEKPYNSESTGPVEQLTSLTWAPDVESAIRIAEGNKNYKIIVWFRNAGCKECVKIEQEIFTDADVVKAGKNRLWVKIDTDVNKDQADYYLHGAGAPALLFLDRTGHEYRSYFGAFSKSDMMGMLTNWI